MKNIFRLLLSVLLLVAIRSHATINPGDLVIVGFNASGDDQIALLATANIAQGDTFTITDKGWLSAGGFRTGEGKITWKGLIPISAGTILYIDMDSSYATNFTKSGSFDLAASGDQLFIYTGSDASPTFIYGINFNSVAWGSDATNTATSALPASLTNGQTAVSLTNKSSYIYDEYIDLSDLSRFFTDLGNYNSWKGSTSNYDLSSVLHSGSITVATPGDILLIAYSAADVKELTLVTLKSLNAGTQLKITDRGWTSTGFYSGEGTLIYTVPDGGLPAGGIIHYKSDVSSDDFYQTGSFNLSNSGDQVIIYQGGETAPSFLYALNTLGNWSSSTGSNYSLAPPIDSSSAGSATLLRTTTSTQGNFYYTGITEGTLDALQSSISAFTNYYTYSGSSASSIPAYANFIIDLPSTTGSPTNFSSDRNYIATWTATAPESDSANLIIRPLKDVKLNVQYFDGLGRPLQTILKQGSMVTGNSATADLVIPIEYDEFGREINHYLPYAAGSNDGSFKTTAITDQEFFYNGSSSPIAGQGENIFHSITEYEASPLNRVLETFAPGNNWAGTSTQSTESDRHSIKTKYWVNTVTDSVQIWSVTDISNDFGAYSTSSMYVAGTLFKKVTFDENNNQVIEFKDKAGKVILKKVQLTAIADTGTGKGPTGWLNTYYIYDDLNHLRCVIQPRGVELLIANSWLFNNTILDEQCFRYEYDGKQRMIMKKSSGAGTSYIIYDARDRMAMTQDSVMRSNNQWLYTQYDALNRQIATGLLSDNNNASYHWSHADTTVNYPAEGSYTIDTLTKTFYDDYTWRAGQSNPLSDTRSNSYDGYLQTASNINFPYPQNATTQSNATKGMVVGTKTKVLGTSNTYLYSINFYDDKARVIQTQSQNISGGTDIAITQYSFTGQPLLIITKNEKAGINSQTSVVLTQTTYDSLMRIVKIEKKTSNTKVNGGSMPGSWVTEVQNEYDALGQLKKKKLGMAPLDSLVYDYNIRGWILGMNRNYVKDTASTANWFGFDLGYDKTSFTVNGGSQSYAAAQYNGNIGGMLWRSTGDDMLRKYDFTYDAVNRLTAADFNQLNSNTFSKAAQIDFSVRGLSYDANGNILTMNQSGWKLGGSETIDSLLYTYNTNSNRLLNVLDRKNDTATKLGDFRSSQAYMTLLSNNKTTSATDYNYDGNGNMYVDNNKDISLIHYNYLNLPDSIVITNKGHITYMYDAAGNKLKKVTTEGSKITTTLYLFGNYVNDTLQFLPTEEGRLRFNVNDSSLAYDYFLKDHLGNIRMVLTEQTQTDAYPAATMELADSTRDNTYYSNIGLTRSDLPSGYPVDTAYSNPNNKVAKVNGSGNKIGPAIILKVMAGDKFNLKVNSWWNSENSPGTPINPLSDLLTALNSSVAGVSGGHYSSGDLNSNNALNPGTTDFLNSHSSYNGSLPKAFINWVLFDEQFKFVSSSSGFEQVGSSNTFITHTRTNVAINKSGYLYVYVSNETPNIDVYFDNLQVTHIRGPLLETDEYYPFGLLMRNLSYQSLNFGFPANNYKFNDGNELQNNEFSDGSGLETYDAHNRMYDPQLGRFFQIDELAESHWEESSYSFANNNPILFNDPLGLDPEKSDPDHPKELEGVTVYAVPKNDFWKAQRLYYNIMDQLNQRGASIFQIMQPDLKAMMYRHDDYTKFEDKIVDMTWKSDAIFLEAVSWLIPTGELLKLKYLRYVAKLLKLKKGVNLGRITILLTKLESGIIKEANKILNSTEMKTLNAAFESGTSAEVKIGERTIIYNPEMAASGFTLHGEGFVLGREAFTSSEELGKTVLHELYRLETQGTGELGVNVTASYTKDAFDFAEKASKLLKH